MAREIVSFRYTGTNRAAKHRALRALLSLITKLGVMEVRVTGGAMEVARAIVEIQSK